MPLFPYDDGTPDGSAIGMRGNGTARILAQTLTNTVRVKPEP